RPTLMSFGGRPTKPPYEGKVAERRRAAKAAGKRLRKRKIKPFTYQIMKSEGRRTLPGGFVARATRRYLKSGGFDYLGGTGNVQVFKRSGKRGGFHGEKLLVPRGPSIPALWQNPKNRMEKDVLAEVRKK